MTTSEIPHHRHRYPQGDLPPLATPGKTTPQTARVKVSILDKVYATGRKCAAGFKEGHEDRVRQLPSQRWNYTAVPEASMRLRDRELIP